MWKKFIKNEKGFTGLEAAIVLIAFVVVAAVFSYVMLGAGFFTTQKSQEVVHTGVTQASSSVELCGDVIGNGDGGLTKINDVTMCIQLTSGGTAVDLGQTLIVYSDINTAPTEFTLSGATKFTIPGKYNANTNSILERGEKFDINVVLPATIADNDDFNLEIKPPVGASYAVHRKAPPTISAIMTLV